MKTSRCEKDSRAFGCATDCTVLLCLRVMVILVTVLPLGGCETDSRPNDGTIQDTKPAATVRAKPRPMSRDRINPFSFSRHFSVLAPNLPCKARGFSAKAPNGRIAGVTSAHFIDPTEPPVVRAVWLDVEGQHPMASFTNCWGQPGKLGIDSREGDRTGDYLVMPVVETVPDELVLELDPREKPDLRERIWLPNKDAKAGLGYRLVGGEVDEVETTRVTVVSDSDIELTSQSGSPFISQKTGKVIGTLSAIRFNREFTKRALLLCPSHAIREALSKDGTFPPLSQVIGTVR